MSVEAAAPPPRPRSPQNSAEIEAQIAKYRTSRWTRYVVRPVLITTLILSFVTATIVILNALAPNPRWLWLLPFLAIVLLETIYTTQWTNHPDRLSLDKTLYRLVELFLILVGVRLVTWFVFGEGDIRSIDDLLYYLSTPGEVFITPFFLVGSLLVTGIWFFGILFTRLFNELEINEYEIRYFSLPLAARKARTDDKPIQVARGPLIRRFLLLWIYGGIIMAACVGLSSLDLVNYEFNTNPLIMNRVGMRPSSLIALMLYFFSGFLLLSHARLAELNAHWLINHVEKDPTIEANWKRNSLIALGVVAFIAAFIPIGSGLPIQPVINFLIAAVGWFLSVIFSLFSFILLFLMSLLGPMGNDQVPPEVEPFEPPEYLPPAEPPVTMTDTTTYLLTSMFWSVVVGLIVLAVFYIWRARDEDMSATKMGMVLTEIKLWLRQLWYRLSHRIEDFNLNMSERLARLRPSAEIPQPPASPFKFVRVNGLSPRDQVRYFYLSTVKRAAQKGVGRDDSETPLEYIDDLKTAWPEASDELDELTDAFLEARYSKKTIPADEAGAIKSTWKQIKGRLRGRSR